MNQTKKNPDDPDFDKLNPQIVELARSNGYIRQPLELFLDGQLTWMEALELMVLVVGKEYRSQSKILIDALQEKPVPLPNIPCLERSSRILALQ